LNATDVTFCGVWRKKSVNAPADLKGRPRHVKYIDVKAEGQATGGHPDATHHLRRRQLFFQAQDFR
jgi:hypothetical protein